MAKKPRLLPMLSSPTLALLSALLKEIVMDGFGRLQPVLGPPAFIGKRSARGLPAA